jgi:hypothetical protein
MSENGHTDGPQNGEDCEPNGDTRKPREKFQYKMRRQPIPPLPEECRSPYCSNVPYYEHDGLCRDCHERLLSRQYRKQLVSKRVKRGTTAKSMRLMDDAEAK